MANQKLKQEELDQLQELQQKNTALVRELGEISLLEINLQERSEGAKKFLSEVKQAESELVNQLQENYGVGSIDLQKGEFIPSETATAQESEVPAKE